MIIAIVMMMMKTNIIHEFSTSNLEPTESTATGDDGGDKDDYDMDIGQDSNAVRIGEIK